MRSSDRTIKTVLYCVLGLLVALTLGVLGIGWMQGSFRTPAQACDYLRSFGAAGPLVLTAIQALQVVLPVLPGFLGCMVGSTLFGASGGFWCNYIGISLGSIAAYWLAKTYGEKLVCTLIPMEKYQGFIRWINGRRSYTVIFVLAILLPLAPDDFLCYFSGLVRMPCRKFTIIILLAKPWCILAYSLGFAQLF